MGPHRFGNLLAVFLRQEVHETLYTLLGLHFLDRFHVPGLLVGDVQELLHERHGVGLLENWHWTVSIPSDACSCCQLVTLSGRCYNFIAAPELLVLVIGLEKRLHPLNCLSQKAEDFSRVLAEIKVVGVLAQLVRKEASCQQKVQHSAKLGFGLAKTSTAAWSFDRHVHLDTLDVQRVQKGFQVLVRLCRVGAQAKHLWVEGAHQ